jgi:hypothetical protein
VKCEPFNLHRLTQNAKYEMGTKYHVLSITHTTK